MAFREKYSGNWESLRGYSYDAVLFQDTVNTDPAKDIKIKSVQFRRTANDRILTSSVDIIFENTYTFSEFDDLLSNESREWMVRITEHGDRTNIFFSGYLAVDINECSFSKDTGSIRISASDELLKLKDVTISDVTTIDFGVKYSFKDILTAGLWHINETTIYINSALFYSTHTKTSGNTLFEQSYLDGDYFYENNVETINYWDAINDILKSTNSYLYLHKNQFHIERYNDISRTGFWVAISHTTGNNFETVNRKETYNKQTQFDYANVSQTLIYESGVSDYTVNIEPEEYISRLPNSWDTPLEIVTNLYLADASINDEQWYINDFYETDFTPSQSTGTNNLGMANYIQYDTSVRYTGNAINYLVYKMPFTMNSGDSTRIEVKFRSWVQVGLSSEEDDEFVSQMYIRNSNDSPDANYYYRPVDDDENASEGEMSESRWNWKLKGNRTTGSNLVEFSKTYDIGIPTVKSSFNLNDKILLFFHPPYLYRNETRYYPDMTTFGDFEVKVIVENIDNQFLYDVNEGFINTKEEDLNIYDITSFNVKNGIYLSDGTKADPTVGWTDDGGVSYDSLVDHYIKNEVGYLYKTRKGLSADIIFKTETFMKPLSLLDDNNLTGIDFIVKEYTYDFVNSRYSFTNLKEYSTDKGEINII